MLEVFLHIGAACVGGFVGGFAGFFFARWAFIIPRAAVLSERDTRWRGYSPRLVKTPV